MKLHSIIWFLLFGFAYMTGINQASACGAGKCGMERYEKQHNKDHASCCSRSHANQHNGQNSHSCPEKNDCGSCPCSGFCSFSSFSGGLAAEFLTDLTRLPLESGDRQAFYFAAHIPEAVYLPIWQPPKI